jgi:arylsulfatase
MDILPTLLEMAGVKHPGSSFRGREVANVHGASWLSYLSTLDPETSIHDGITTPVGWELFGRRAMRKGNYKIVYIPAPMGSGEWELYDLTTDLGEVVSKAKPEILIDLLDKYSKYSEETDLYDSDSF